MRPSMRVRQRWFRQGAAAWRRAQITMGVSEREATQEAYVCPLCMSVDYAARRGQFKCFTESALFDGSLTAEHVPPKSLGGRPLLLTCRECNNWAGSSVDSHARRRENPRDVFLGRTSTKVTATTGGHKVAGRFTVKDGAYCLDITRKNAHRRGAPEAFSASIGKLGGSDGDIILGFDSDEFDDRRARASWLRAAYLTMFAMGGFRATGGPEFERIRRQIREPEIEHIPTFLIDTHSKDDWSHRAIVRIKEPEALHCWGMLVGHYLVCLPWPGEAGLYERIAAERKNDSKKMVARADVTEWPTEPTFGLPPASS